MNKKTATLVLAFVVTLILFSNVSADTSVNNFNDPSHTPIVDRIVTKDPLQDEPKDWPIVKVIRSESVDERTGVTHTHGTIIREQPSESKSNLSSCGSVQAAYSCISDNEKWVYDWDTLSTSNGWITSHSYHWQTKYCRSGDPLCHFRKPYQLRVWWTRSNQSWRADNADVGWGCSWCAVCEGGTTDYVYHDYFTPQWSGNNSYYYTYTSTTYQKMDQHDVGGWRAGSWSDAYYGWQYIGELKTNADG